MKENIFTGLFAIIVAGISAYLQIIAIPMLILITVMIIDYVTGMVSAYINSQLSSRIGVIGILKKLGYLALVCVGVGVDYILYAGLSKIGIDSNVTMIFGLLVTVWLIINELLSILENLSRIGVPMPTFLTKIVSKLKITVESKVE